MPSRKALKTRSWTSAQGRCGSSGECLRGSQLSPECLHVVLIVTPTKIAGPLLALHPLCFQVSLGIAQRAGPQAALGQLGLVTILAGFLPKQGQALWDLQRWRNTALDCPSLCGSNGTHALGLQECQASRGAGVCQAALSTPGMWSPFTSLRMGNLSAQPPSILVNFCLSTAPATLP